MKICAPAANIDDAWDIAQNNEQRTQSRFMMEARLFDTQDIA